MGSFWVSIGAKLEKHADTFSKYYKDQQLTSQEVDEVYERDHLQRNWNLMCNYTFENLTMI